MTVEINDTYARFFPVQILDQILSCYGLRLYIYSPSPFSYYTWSLPSGRCRLSFPSPGRWSVRVRLRLSSPCRWCRLGLTAPFRGSGLSLSSPGRRGRLGFTPPIRWRIAGSEVCICGDLENGGISMLRTNEAGKVISMDDEKKGMR
jgi:hypothetical protein